MDESAATEIGQLRPGDYVVISVSDEGAGLTPEAQERLFEPFFTTKGIGEGVGLSLASAHGVIRQSDGELTVESKPGQGATVRIYLPCQDTEEAE